MALRFDPRTGQFVDDGQPWTPGATQPVFGGTPMQPMYTFQPGASGQNAIRRAPQYPQLPPMPQYPQPIIDRREDMIGPGDPGYYRPPYVPQPAYGEDTWANKMGQAQHDYSTDTWREQTQSKYDQYAASSPLSPTGTPLTPPSASPWAGPYSDEEGRAKFASARDRTQSKYNTVKSLLGPGQ
jgi:hypothetical protein